MARKRLCVGEELEKALAAIRKRLRARQEERRKKLKKKRKKWWQV